MTTTLTHSATAAGRGVFARILVAIDGSREALEAARQAAVVLDGAGQLTLLAVWTPGPGTNGARAHDGAPLDEARGEAAVHEALDHVGRYTAAFGKLVRDREGDELLREIERGEDTLVAAGASGPFVRAAPCSVLVARRADRRFPRRIVVGLDGSPQSAAAYAAGRCLAARFAAELTALVARGGKGVKELVLPVIAEERVEVPADPVTALVEASAEADLVIVGSRGLHHSPALGSVAARVAESARCSALVVREPLWQPGWEDLAA